MRRLQFTGTILVVLALILLVGVVTAAPAGQNGPSIPNGAQLYDNWMAATGQSAPAGDMPIWARQTTNSRSGPDTWRCVSCHGWDGMGKDGAYRAGSNYTGFPNLYAASRSMSEAEIIAALKGGKNAEHNFSGVLDDALLADLAIFISQGFVDDTQYIDLTTLKDIDGNVSVGKDLYTQGCASCHNADGAGQALRYEGQEASLVTVANTDPWRFLHKARYGTPGNPMQKIGFDLGWQAINGRDVLAYLQSLPDPKAKVTPKPALENRPPEAENPTGPARSWFSGILTALGAMLAGLGFNLLLFALLIAVIFLLVWVIRGRKK
jgi:mono/diheme cytochrome c family protein